MPYKILDVVATKMDKLLDFFTYIILVVQ